MADITYIATPYSNPDPAVRDGRWHLANLGCAYVIKRDKKIVYGPITMSDPIDRIMAGKSNTLGSDYWVAFDQSFMSVCNNLIVFKIPGWDKSNGVATEIKHFTDAGAKVEYLEPSTVFASLSKDELRAIPDNAWKALPESIVKKYKPKATGPAPKPEIVYIATPSAGSNSDLSKGRSFLANLTAAHIVKTRNDVVYAPVAMATPIVKMAAAADEKKYEKKVDEAYMASCSSIVVLKVPGWEKNSGVAREIKHFEDTGRPVEYMEPADLIASLSREELKSIPEGAWKALPEDIIKTFKPEAEAAKAPASAKPARHLKNKL